MNRDEIPPGMHCNPFDLSYQRQKEELIRNALSLMEVAQHLNSSKYEKINNYSPYTVLDKLKRGELRAIWVPELGWRFPEYQFDLGFGLLVNQEEISLEIDTVSIALWMRTSHPELGGKSPVEYLRRNRGKSDKVFIISLAKTNLEEGK